MLSLSPRFDLYRFVFPKDFLPTEIYNKYEKILRQNPGVLVNPIDYLNESIQKVNFPGIADIVTPQEQHSFNTISGDNKLNIEPIREATYNTPKNPLNCIENEFRVEFRMNQGLYNYFMIYETIFYQLCKPLYGAPQPILYIDILNDEGKVISKIKFIDSYINGIDGLEFDYSKLTRDMDTFGVSFKFNNIDFEI